MKRVIKCPGHSVFGADCKIRVSLSQLKVAYYLLLVQPCRKIEKSFCRRKGRSTSVLIGATTTTTTTTTQKERKKERKKWSFDFYKAFKTKFLKGTPYSFF